MDLPGYIPPPFDAAHYRAANADLQFDNDAAAQAHFEREGRAAGRIASPLATREGLLAFLGRDRSVLEIGPFCRPLMTGPNVDYLDVLDADGLKVRAARYGLDASDCPEHIRYVGDIAGVDQTYDVVVSSHAIEHQPDLVSHLQSVEHILRPGGMFALLIPDKRYCFDHFLPETSIADVLQAYADRRTIHTLASVIEHDALATHNDAARHWRGDHRDPAHSFRSRRIREAVDRFEMSDGAYVDVHAWQFTPENFCTIVNTLDELGMIKLEAIAVWDTPRDRQEFCAILQLRRPVRGVAPRRPDMNIVFLQTADPFRYQKLLDMTAPTVIEFCRRHSCRYESFTGIWRGAWNWQATYNRIPMLKQLLDRGFSGWAIYMDADAYINDLNFDLPTYLAEHNSIPAIFAESGVTGETWDVNAGVAMINCGHPEGRRLIELWADGFAQIDDAALKASDKWRDGDNDQDILQAILRDDQALGNAVLIESMDFMNSRHATFIRQHLRAQTADLSERVRSVAAEVHDIFAQDGVRAAPEQAQSILDERGRFSIFHPVRTVPRLVAAPAASLRLDLADRAVAAWTAARDHAEPPPFQRSFAELLERKDTSRIAADLAALGQSELAQGMLGGARQHWRAAADPVFAYRRAQRTYDALLSLAEIVGAISIENPESGLWGENSQFSAAHLAVLASEAMGISLDPPPQIGGYLGIATGGSRILHLRMIEAAHTAWRARQTLDLSGGSRVLELGGGVGLTAWYGHQLGIAGHAIVDGRLIRAVQSYVLGDVPGDAVSLAAQVPSADGEAWDLLIVEDGFFERLPADCLALLRQVHEVGIAQILSVSQEGTIPDVPVRATMRAMMAETGGYRLVSRQRHALRAGYVEEVYNLR